LGGQKKQALLTPSLNVWDAGGERRKEIGKQHLEEPGRFRREKLLHLQKSWKIGNLYPQGRNGQVSISRSIKDEAQEGDYSNQVKEISILKQQ